MEKNQKKVYYSEYLHLDRLLSAQHMVSEKYNNPSHDEMLFIIVHQAFEIWFKQILHELNSILEIMSPKHIPEKNLFTIVSRMERIIKIQGLLSPQIDILETMTPMDFLDFRDLLIPASGFQSLQFREIEIKMGLSTRNRHQVNEEFFLGRLSDKDRMVIKNSENADDLFILIERWLERMPFTEYEGRDFWKEYREQVELMIKKDEKVIKSNKHISEIEKKSQLVSLKTTMETFEALFDEEKFKELRSDKKRGLSRRATLNALFIHLYRDEPVLHIPFRLLSCLKNIDENFTSWRYRHALLAQRMIGTKIGTGGSAGHKYLKMTAEKNRIYEDIVELSTFLIPRVYLPELPKDIQKDLSYGLEVN